MLNTQFHTILSLLCSCMLLLAGCLAQVNDGLMSTVCSSVQLECRECEGTTLTGDPSQLNEISPSRVLAQSDDIITKICGQVTFSTVTHGQEGTCFYGRNQDDASMNDLQLTKEASAFKTTDIITIAISASFAVFLSAIISFILLLFTYQQLHVSYYKDRFTASQTKLAAQKKKFRRGISKLKKQVHIVLRKLKERNLLKLNTGQKIKFQRLQEENESYLEAMKRKNEHELCLKALEIFHDACKDKRCKGMNLTLGSMELTLKVEYENTNEMTDGESCDDYTSYTAGDQSMFTSRERAESQLDNECMISIEEVGIIV